MKRTILTLIFLCTYWLLSATNVGKAVDENGVKESNFAIYYRFDDANFDPTYLTNGHTAEFIKHYLENSPRIDSIVIYSWSSPEGLYAYNLRLSKARAKTAKQFLLSNSPDSLKLNSGKIHISPEAENWPGLTRMVEENYFRHDREKLLKILYAQGIGEETRKWRIKQLDNGYTWGYLLRNYMPKLRTATWICIWAEVLEPMPQVAPITSNVQSSEKPLTIPTPAPEEKFEPATFMLRTNLLVPALNIGLEYPIDNNWSVGTDYYFPWFKRNPDNRNCFQILGLDIHGRYWFGKDRTEEDRLRGHALGAYVYGGYYDLEYQFAGNQGEFVSAGLEYVYAKPIFKDKMHLEFSVALGYLYYFIQPYDVFESGGLAYKTGYTKDFHWFGPTKAGVSLVVPITIKRRAER